MPKVFLDTSIFLASLRSPQGGSSEVLRYAVAGAVEAFLSDDVVDEVARHIHEVDPALRSLLLQYLAAIPFTVISVTADEVEWAATFTDSKNSFIKTSVWIPLPLGMGKKPILQNPPTHQKTTPPFPKIAQQDQYTAGQLSFFLPPPSRGRTRPQITTTPSRVHTLDPTLFSRPPKTPRGCPTPYPTLNYPKLRSPPPPYEQPHHPSSFLSPSPTNTKAHNALRLSPAPHPPNNKPPSNPHNTPTYFCVRLPPAHPSLFLLPLSLYQVHRGRARPPPPPPFCFS